MLPPIVVCQAMNLPQVVSFAGGPAPPLPKFMTQKGKYRSEGVLASEAAVLAPALSSG